MKDRKKTTSSWNQDNRSILRGLDNIFTPFIIIKEKEWTPPIDIYESQEAIILKAELAGVDQDDLRIEIFGQNLIIIGERRDCSEERRDVVHQVEIDYGRFRRQLILPCEVDAEKATATVENGFLTLILPKLQIDHKIINIPID